MHDSEQPEHNAGDRSQPERVIDISGEDPVVIDDESGYPSFAGGAERVRVFVAGGNSRTCVIPLLVILLLLCCSCIVLWSLTDNLF